MPTTARLPTNYSRPPKLLNNLFKNTNRYHRGYTRAQQEKGTALSITPLDSIRRAIARRNGVADPTVSGGVHGQGGRIENGLFPASHTAEELARIQELSQRNAGGPGSSQATRRRRERDRQPGPIHRMVNA